MNEYDGVTVGAGPAGSTVAKTVANLRGIRSAIASGRDAGKVTVAAVQANDVTVKKLHKYEVLFKRLVRDKEFLDTTGFSNHSDEDIENSLREMIERDVLPFFTKPHPLWHFLLCAKVAKQQPEIRIVYKNGQAPMMCINISVGLLSSKSISVPFYVRHVRNRNSIISL